MKDDEKQVSEGLNQIFEIINAKGDLGELSDIVENGDDSRNEEDSLNK